MILSGIMSAYPLAGVKTIVLQFAFFIIVYVFYSLIRDERDMKNYIASILIVAMILVTISVIYLFIDGFNLIDIISKNRTRVYVLITNPEALTNFYVISFPFLLTTLLLKPQRLKKYSIIVMLVYIGIGLILVMSRSAILGIILSSAIVLFILRRKRFHQLLFTLICFGLLFLFYPPLNETLTFFLRIEEGMSARDQIWKMSLEMIKDHPIFGIGPGAYKYETFNYFPYMFNSWWGKLMIYFYDITDGINFSHNYFLVLFTELGILGFVTAIALPFIYFRIGLKTLKKYRYESQEKYFFIIALFAAGTSIIFRNFFNSIGLLYLGGISTDLPFWLIFSSLIYFYKQPLSEKALRQVDSNITQ
jgi:putative inorganic carbon (HCO3(-)) transporter